MNKILNPEPLKFQKMLRRAWLGVNYKNITNESSEGKDRKPLMSIISRNDKSRVLTNEKELGKMAEELGFKVELLNPAYNVGLEDVLLALQRSDLMIGVHGAAMTHFLFMRPNSSFVQVGKPAFYQAPWFLFISPVFFSFHLDFCSV